MYEPIVAWAGLALLFVLCLPIRAVRKLVLELAAWSLRLALLAVLGGAAYLWFRPAELPAGVLDALSACPRLLAILPDPMTANFGVAVAALVVGTMLPVLAVLDASRKATCRRPDRVEPRPAESAVETPRDAPAAPAVRGPAPRPVGRAAAADVIASAGSRPARAADPQHR